MSKFKIGDKVRCVEASQGQWIEVGVIYTVRYILGEYICLDEITEKHDYHESRFELVSGKTELNYREMRPSGMIKVCIDDNEFEVPLGDLVHTTALLAVTDGIYGCELWDALTEALGRDRFVEDCETLFEFLDKSNEAIDYFFQLHLLS